MLPTGCSLSFWVPSAAQPWEEDVHDGVSIQILALTEGWEANFENCDQLGVKNMFNLWWFVPTGGPFTKHFWQVTWGPHVKTYLCECLKVLWEPTLGSTWEHVKPLPHEPSISMFGIWINYIKYVLWICTWDCWSMRVTCDTCLSFDHIYLYCCFQNHLKDCFG